MKTGHRVLDPNKPASIPGNLCALAVMTKAPRAGEVKTRLVPPLSHDEAAQLNRAFLRDICAVISAACWRGPESIRDRIRVARGVGVYTPLGAESAYENVLSDDFFLIPQRGDHFGDRLNFAAEDLFRVGFGAVCLINSDSPTVPAEVFAQAVELLGLRGDRIVLGASDDGGYYLIGMKEPHPEMFEGIDWSTERVFDQTLARVTELGVEVKLLPTGYDVDDHATLQRLRSELLGENSRDGVAPNTRKVLREIIEREGRAGIWPGAASRSGGL
jgi:uncharacterized protein